MLYGMGIDITERKAAEDALAAARDAAESANRLKDEFLATLSHELRTPLNAILGYARMLRANAVPPDKRERAVEVIERNAIAQTQLVEDLLDVSRITSGKMRLDPHTLTAATPLGEALESIRPAAEAKQITLALDIDPFAGSVHADGNRLQQVFWNLLSNAVKFTRHGGRIAIRLERIDRTVEISIGETAPGIAPEFLPFVFEPFRQADARFAREHGGLGLGLAISKQLIELHGGSIRARSDGLGQGATFVVTLPRKVPADETRDHTGRGSDTARASASDVPPAPLAGLDVLVVDDEEDSLELLRHVLESAGAAVRVQRRGDGALAEFDRRVPGVVVTDLGLPEMDGFELLRRIRGRERAAGRQVPAIAVTAYARHADRARVLASGFAAHVAKPIDPDELVAALVAALQPR
jgi:CheY-like chemotaxis protein/nitrogen-specific signal transduction histidine kinase